MIWGGVRVVGKLQLPMEGGRLWIEEKVALDLSRWIGAAQDDGLTSEQALSELRGRPVPWTDKDAKA